MQTRIIRELYIHCGRRKLDIFRRFQRLVAIASQIVPLNSLRFSLSLAAIAVQVIVAAFLVSSRLAGRSLQASGCVF